MVPPVPIPNTVVKHSEAESTWVETPWEDRKLPVSKSICLVQVLFSWVKRLMENIPWSLAEVKERRELDKKAAVAAFLLSCRSNSFFLGCLRGVFLGTLALSLIKVAC